MRGWRILAGLAFGLVLGAADAPGVITKPDWLRKPTPEQLLGVWPREAMKRNIGGHAVIDCAVTVQGALNRCTVVSESPAGMGFGAAAIALTPQFVMKPQTVNGQPVGGATVRIPINWEDPGVFSTGSHLASGSPVYNDTETVISGVQWVAAPTYAEVVAAYPQAARKAKAGGHAALLCRFKDDGRMGDCRVLRQQPDSLGFGKAAKSLVARFQAPRTIGDGEPLKGAWTQIPFTFDPAMLEDGEARVIGRPQWVRLPQMSSLAAAYPEAARKAGVAQGRVTLSCLVGQAGRLEGCEVASQDPAGLGFDQAGLALSSDFMLSIWTNEGLPTVGGRVRVPVRYVLPQDASAAPPAAKP